MVKKYSVLLLSTGLILLLASVALAAVGGYDLDWWSVDGGGGQSSSGAYTLSGAIGQLDAGTLSGGSYVLQGGFIPGMSVAAIQREIFFPLVIKK